MDSFMLTKKIVKVLDEKKGENIQGIKISELTVIADYFIIVTGTSNPHLTSLVSEVQEEMEKFGVVPRAIEGRATGWILLDYGDVVVHIFLPREREYYDLERLWSDADFLDIDKILSE